MTIPQDLPLAQSIGSPTSPIRILYLSPTRNRKAAATRAGHFASRIPTDVSVDFYTAPESAPLSIDGTRDGIVSAGVVLQQLGLVEQGAVPRYPLDRYHGIIIGCFSAHPLIPALKESLLVSGNLPPIISLMESAIFFALQLGPTFGIVTTGTQWEPLFDEHVRALGIASSRYKGTRGCGHNAASVDSADQAVIDSASGLVKQGATVIVLGCGGMTTLRDKIERAVNEGCDGHVPVVDGVQASIDQAIAFARMGIHHSRRPTV